MAESLALIDMQASQGVNTVIATPHFYANYETVDSFLERRKRSFELLKANLPSPSPEIILGAEVRYYQGISRMSDLKLLRIEGSKVLLLEMPVSKWSEYMIRELIEMSSLSGIKIVLAHIERYLPYQSSGVWRRLYECGILMQVNANFFAAFSTKGKAVSLLKKSKIHFVGSDCHNTETRPPNIGKAFEIITRKLGKHYLDQMNAFGYSILGRK